MNLTSDHIWKNLDPYDALFNVAEAVAVAMNEAAFHAGRMRCQRRQEGASPEQAFLAALQAAIDELQRLRGLVVLGKAPPQQGEGGS